MAKPKNTVRRAQVMHSWGIILGMSGLPILALMSKVFPQRDTIWLLLAVVCGLVLANSVFGYLRASAQSRKTQEVPVEAH